MLLSLARKTLRDHRRSVLGWGLGMAALTLLQLAVYPSVHSQGAKMRDLLNSYPSAFKAMFNMQSDFTTGPGYLAVETFSLLVPLMLVGLGIALGTGAIASEEERGTLDLLLANPVSRVRVLTAKAFGSLAALIAVAVFFFLVVLAAVAALDMGVGTGRLAFATFAALVLGCVCGAVTLLAGAATGRRGVAIGVGAGFAVVSYFLDSLAEITKVIKPWRVVSVFHQASPAGALRGDLGITGLAVTVAVAVAACVAAMYLFNRRDLAA
ncbi:MAG: ABC transporter permease [Micromonosporaceae bacterium]